MKAFRVVLFAAGFVALSVGFNLAYRTMMSRGGSSSVRAEQYHKLASSTKVLVTGDSRAAFGFDPRSIEHSFNYGLVAADYAIVYRRLEQLLAVDNSVEVVVLTIAPNMLYLPPKRQREWSAADSAFLMDGFGIHYGRASKPKNESRENQSTSRVRQFLSDAFPYAGNINVLWAGLRSRDVVEVERGFTRTEGPTHRWGQDGMGRAARLFFGRTDPSGAAVLELMNIARLCSKHDIRLLLVRWPILESYRKAVDQFVPDSAYQSMVKSVLRADTTVRYADMHDLLEEQEDLFADVDHLNEKGAFVFGQLLGQRVKRLALSETH